MQKYRCHKIVEACDLKDKNVRIGQLPNGAVTVEPGYGEPVLTIPAKTVSHLTMNEIEDGYLVKYADGYISWSPRAAFEEGYALIPPDAR
jgi:hypothetical protein